MGSREQRAGVTADASRENSISVDCKLFNILCTFTMPQVLVMVEVRGMGDTPVGKSSPDSAHKDLTFSRRASFNCNKSYRGKGQCAEKL